MTKQLQQEILDTFTSGIAEIDACTNNDWVLAYPTYGIGIRFDDKNQPITTSIVRAETIVPEQNNMPEEAWAYTPIVKNGAGEQAKIMQRQEALRIHRAHLVSSADNLRNIMAAA